MFCNTLLGVVPFVLFLGPVRLSPSLSFREVLRGVRASLVRFLLCPLHPYFFSFLFFFSFFCPASCIPMGPGRSSALRIGGESSMESGSGQTGGESNHLAMVVLRDDLGEPPSPLGKGKDKIDEIKYPVGSEYLKSVVQNALAVGPSRVEPLFWEVFARRYRPPFGV